jgi:hypothetical protein
MAADVKLFRDLDELERDAGTALSRETRPQMFDRLDWFRLVHRFTPPPGELLAIRSKNGAASAWLFLAQEGTEAFALSNWYCLRFGPVIDGGNGEAALDAVVHGVRQAGVSRIFLSMMGGEDPLPAALRRNGWMIRFTQTNVNWRIRIKGKSFEDYWAERPSKLRNTARRRAKTAGLRIEILDRFDEKTWADYETVYAASWKPAEGSPELMRQFAQAEAAAGALRLGLAYMDDQAVAAQLWTVENNVATIHKLAYREDAKHYSPGTVLSVELFRRAIDVDKVDVIDFGYGDHSYKRDWMDESAPLYTLTAYDLRSVRGLIGIARSAASKLVARLRSH